MTVEAHKIYDIGMDADGDALCAEVCERGFVNWFKTFAEFDYDFDENGDLPDERPTIPEQHLVDSWWDDDAGREGRRETDPTAPSAAA